MRKRRELQRGNYGPPAGTSTTYNSARTIMQCIVYILTPNRAKGLNLHCHLFPTFLIGVGGKKRKKVVANVGYACSVRILPSFGGGGLTDSYHPPFLHSVTYFYYSSTTKHAMLSGLNTSNALPALSKSL